MPFGSHATTASALDGPLPMRAHPRIANATFLWQSIHARNGTIEPVGPLGANWPRLFLLGTQKGATTALSRAFEHAGACASRQGKEEHMLTTDGMTADLEDGAVIVSRYTGIFPDWDTTHEDCSVSGHYDGNPFLLTDMGAPFFLGRWMPHDLRPNVRLIASLREPAGRMLSWHNQHRSSYGADPRVFAAHVEEELNVWHDNGRVGSAQRGVRNFWDLDNATWTHSPPLDMMIGMYHHSLARWRRAWPRNQLFVMNFDSFVSDSTSHLSALSDFTGLDLLSHPLPEVNFHSHEESSIANMCCETFCALQRAAFHDANTLLYGIMDADDRSKAGPPTEPNFGRFKAPKCVYCNSTDDAEDFVAKDGPVLPGCVERVPNLNTAGRRHSTLALHLHADQRHSTIALTPAAV